MQTSPKIARQVVTPFPPGRLPELYNSRRTPMQACHAMDAIVPPSRTSVCQPDIIHWAQAYTRPARGTSLIGMEPAGMNHKTIEQHPQHIAFEPGKTSFMNLPGRKPLPYMTRYFRNPFPGVFDFGGSHIVRIKLEHRHIGVGHKDPTMPRLLQMSATRNPLSFRHHRHMYIRHNDKSRRAQADATRSEAPGVGPSTNGRETPLLPCHPGGESHPSASKQPCHALRRPMQKPVVLPPNGNYQYR